MDEIFHIAWGPLSLWLREERAARIIERHRKKRRRDMLRGCFEAWVHGTIFMPGLATSDEEPIHEEPIHAGTIIHCQSMTSKLARYIVANGFPDEHRVIVAEQDHRFNE